MLVALLRSFIAVYVFMWIAGIILAIPDFSYFDSTDSKNAV